MYLRIIDNRRLDTQSLIYRKVYVESNYQNNNEENYVWDAEAPPK